MILPLPYPGLTVGNKWGSLGDDAAEVGAPEVAWHCGRGQWPPPPAGSTMMEGYVPE